MTDDEMLATLWKGHGPTQGMRQATTSDAVPQGDLLARRDAALASREMFRAELTRAGYGAISTEIADAGPFFYAEPYHQQYLAANPNGSAGSGATGIACPAPLKREEAPAR